MNALRRGRGMGSGWSCFLLLVSLAACASSAQGPLGDEAAARPAASAAPRVSAAASASASAEVTPLEVCLESARRGTLGDNVPPKSEGFEVRARESNRVSLVRAGRPLLADEGRALWDAFRDAHILQGDEVSSSSHGEGPRSACAFVGSASCFLVTVWGCKTPPERLAGWMREIAAAQHLDDAELQLDVELLEPRGPRCKEGPACVPAPHYSTKTAVYDPRGARRPMGDGAGICKDDGDCEGIGELCLPWYLTGGPQPMLYVGRQAPTFCGCQSGACGWFEQN
ncbi:MAG: hypothetical protein U0414_06260 [Polyangiaceae bacterium]